MATPSGVTSGLRTREPRRPSRPPDALRKALQQASELLAGGLDWRLVCEDDCMVVEPAVKFKSIFGQVLRRLPLDWALLQLGCQTAGPAPLTHRETAFVVRGARCLPSVS